MLGRNGDYRIARKNEMPPGDERRNVPLHRLMVEKILGRTLPRTAEVHHIDQYTWNNSNSNLVVCQDAKYHKLLHRRTRALKACGHASWRQCVHCKKYGSPEEMISVSKNSYSVLHPSCRPEYLKKLNGSTLTVRLPIDLISALSAEARKDHRTLGGLVQKILAEYVV